MNILLTNDDGITSQALHTLAHELKQIAECFIIAPHEQKSASSHAVSLGRDITVRSYYNDDVFFGYQVDGTPVDCVKLALCELLDTPPTLIVSGINRGSNTGVSVYYSGTVAAAREGLMAGIPAIAVSMTDPTHNEFTFAAGIVRCMVERVLAQGGLSPGIMLNVNIPPCSAETYKGVRVTRQAPSYFVEKFIKNDLGEGHMRYTLGGEMIIRDADGTSDEEAVQQGFVAVSPLQLDLTDYGVFNKIEHMASNINTCSFLQKREKGNT